MSRLSYRNRSLFYFRTKKVGNAYGAPHNLNRPSLGAFAARLKPHESRDLSSREHIEVAEAIRNPRDKDFYQDHTYHDQWEQRELDKANARMLKQRYGYFSPEYQYNPWVWYPGDMVEVVSGEQTGQRGTILAVIPYKNEIIVQNINVKDITVPATDTRPEQVVQREHPIDAKMVRHVDPTTNDLCDLQIITVRKRADAAAGKEGDGAASGAAATSSAPTETEKKRISLQSGALLPIPPEKDPGAVETGDPLKDTPYHDANEVTYNPEEELSVLVERKLKVMEEGFVKQLKRSYRFHNKLAQSNARQLQKFQRDAQLMAMDKVTRQLNEQAESLDDWWFTELAPHMEQLQREENERIAQEHAAAEAQNAAATSSADDGDSNNDDIEEEEEEEEEQQADATTAPDAEKGTTDVKQPEVK